MTAAPFDLVAVAAGGGSGERVLRTFRLESASGGVRPLQAQRWCHQPEPEEEEVLDLALPPTIDVGCGPGRHTIALARRGLLAIGVDVGPATVALARRRGAAAILGSIFQPLPGAGSWGSALLLDGNVGIGGDPQALLGRVRDLLRPSGRVLAEVSPPGEPSRSERVQLHGLGETSEPFDWAVVSADELPVLAAATGFALASLWGRRGRWFARLDAI